MPIAATSKATKILECERAGIATLVRKPATSSSALRRQTVEHMFGTLKAWMGSTHFLTTTLPCVRTEMGLQVLAYNLKRAFKVLGTARLIAAMRA